MISGRKIGAMLVTALSSIVALATAAVGAPSDRVPGLVIAAPAEPRTKQEKDFGSSAQWSWAGQGTNVLRGVHASRAMDLIRIKAPRTQPLLIEDVKADRVRQFLDIYDKDVKPTVQNITIQRIRAGFLKRGIRLRYGSNAIVIRDFRLSLLTPNRTRGDIPVGIGLYDQVHDVVIERGVIDNVLTELSDDKKYWNADGISLERGVHDVVLRDLLIRNCTDGGIDSKATNVLIDRVRVEGCGRNLRLWEDTNIGTFESVNPVKRGGVGMTAHIALYQGVERVRIKKLIVRATTRTPLFMMEVDAPATVIIDSQDIKVPAGTPLIGGKYPDRLKIVWKSGKPRI